MHMITILVIDNYIKNEKMVLLPLEQDAHMSDILATKYVLIKLMAKLFPLT